MTAAMENEVRERARPLGQRAEWRGGAPFDLRVVLSGGKALARVTGPLDLEHAPQFRERVLPLCGSARCAVVDLRRADYLDSAGARELVLLREELARQGGELRLVVRPGSGVERTLQRLTLPAPFAVHDRALDAWIQRAA